jgi:hypothetical protein
MRVYFSALVRKLTLLTLVVAVSSQMGCSGKDKNLDPRVDQPITSYPTVPSIPILLTARVADAPNKLNIHLLNQTDADVIIDPRYFAVVFNKDMRTLRPYKPGLDWAVIPTTTLQSEGQLTLLLEYKNLSQSLLGQHLIFNPEPTGLPPARAVIEPPAKTGNDPGSPSSATVEL